MRVAVYGYHQGSLAAAVEQMQAQGDWEVVYWAGATVGAAAENHRFAADIPQWHLGHFVEDRLAVLSAADEQRIAEFIRQLPAEQHEQFCDQLSRHPFASQFSAADYDAYLPRVLRGFLGNLRAKGAQQLFLQNLPHQGFDLALYWSARLLELPTVLCYQSILPNRFFFCHQLEDFGWFHQVVRRVEQPAMELPVGFEKDLFYMRDVPADARLHNPRGWSPIQRVIRDWKLEWKAWKQRVGWYRWTGKSHGFNVDPDEHYHWNLRRQAANCNRWLADHPNTPFVYFPLHLQPELTSSTLGDAYRDQLRAIEALSAWIPDHAVVLVKENPKQTYRYRDQTFFDRLSRLKNVVFVGKQGNTYELLSRAAVVATLSGTVGWEAITGGKSVLVFGRPWYLTLPGAVHWSEQPTWERLTKIPLDRSELQAAWGQLWSLSRPGVVDLNYATSTPQFSDANNQANLVHFFHEQSNARPDRSDGL